MRATSNAEEGLRVSLWLVVALVFTAATSGVSCSAADTDGIQVTIDPQTVTLAPGETRQFSASVTGATDTTVLWSVVETGGGSITSDGLYTAPGAEGTYHVVVTSQADDTQSDTATVEVVPAGACTDSCPAPIGGVTWDCKKRFMYGVNWAWRNWAGDFGGVSAWGWSGVAGASADYSSDMARMKAAGASVIRWWMFPRFLTDSIVWDADDTPSGIGGTLVADIHEALELAEQHDVYLMLTPFSFDNFRSTRYESGIYSRGIKPMLVDAIQRQKLLDNLVQPVAQAVEGSPYKNRMIAWDMINEPEWAMTGPNLYGGEDFTPDGELEIVDHAQMETFLDEMAAVLRANSSALITVGGSAIKWGTAWTHVDQDFYSLHYYDWVYEWFPYDTVTLESVGLDDKPVVMGEFPIQGLSAVGGNPARTLAQLMTDLWNLGYAGGLAWAYNDGSFPWNPQNIQSFADLHPCETAY